MSDHVTVEISDVEPRSIKGTAEDLAVGDTLFDVWGDTHKITKVRKLKNGVKTTRDDGVTDVWQNGESVTFIVGTRKD